MKWLLITTTRRTEGTMGSNPGDEFARLGIEKVIRASDQKAEIDLLDKEVAAEWDKGREFDRVVICGMPLLWSNPNQTCSEIFWWDYLWGSYITHEKKKVLPMGIGHVLVGDPHDGEKYHNAIREITMKSWNVVVREPIHGQPEKWIQSICPSAYAMMDRNHDKQLALCNFMAEGGHFGYLTDDGKRWSDIQEKPASDLLLDMGWTFIAHTHHEIRHAKKLGWPEDRILSFTTAREYLDTYANATWYFGNRMHGAAVCASTGRCRVWGATHDSRLGMVARLGGKATRTSEVSVEALKRWFGEAKPSKPEPRFQVKDQFTNMVVLFNKFMRQT